MVPGLDDTAAARPASPTPSADDDDGAAAAAAADGGGGGGGGDAPTRPSFSGTAASTASSASGPDGAAVAAERLAQVAGLARPPSSAALGGLGGCRLGGGSAPATPSAVVPVDAASAAETGAAPPPPATPPPPPAPTLPGTAAAAAAPPPEPLPTRFSFREFAYLCGPGLLMAVAYLDPGNLEADIQAGANVGYTLLWFFFAAFGAGLLFQGMTARLGIVTGRDLARLCGDAYPKPARVLLWGLLEVALVGADIQETIGSALAISLLSGGRVPLWGGCILVTASAFLVLLLEQCGARHLEAVFGGLIAMQGISSAINYIQAGVPQAEVARGLFIPRLPASAVPFAVGALGALIMPHNIYFASAIVNARSQAADRAAARAAAAADRAAAKAAALGGGGGGGGGGGAKAAAAAALPPSEVTPAAGAGAGAGGAAAPAPPPPPPPPPTVATPPTARRRRRRSSSNGGGGGGPRPLPPSPVAGPARTRVLLTYVRLETVAVLSVAFAINLFIVCLFAHGFYGTPQAAGVGLETAGAYLGDRFGASFKYLWGIGLLASGQSATISLTYAGQIVMAGLLRFEVSSWKRLICTRAVSLVPTLAVAAAYEGARKFDGMNQLLNILQAMVLPFSLIPCIAMAASGRVMSPAFKTARPVLALACGVAVAVACVDGYLLSSFFAEVVVGGGGGGGVEAGGRAVPPGAWVGFGCLLALYYGVMAYFAFLADARRSYFKEGWAWVASRARAGCAAVKEKSRHTRLMDAGAMMEVHF